jgi:hypothetical protein
MAGQALDDSGGAGATPQHPEPRTPVLVENGGLAFAEIGATVTTTRRARINITKTTKSYNYDTTYEITSNDPDLDIAMSLEIDLRDLDRLAREEILQRQYIDIEGLPGSDDTP